MNTVSGIHEDSEADTFVGAHVPRVVYEAPLKYSLATQ